MSRAQSLGTTIQQGWFLFYRDFQFRYGLTALGYFWSVVRPIASAMPLIFVGKEFNFGNGQGGIPYEAHALLGFILWHLFWDAATMPILLMNRSRTALRRIPVRDGALVWASVLGASINFIVNLAILAFALPVFGIWPAPTAALAFLASPALIIGGLAIGIPLAPITAVYHDLRYGITFLGQILLWSAPILHEMPPSGKLYWLNKLNPLTYLINAPRNLFFHSAPAAWGTWSLALAIALVGLAVSWVYYRATLRMSYDYIV